MTAYQWQFTTLGILAGFGTGCVVGVLAGRWVWRYQQSSVAVALRELKEEVSSLSRVVHLELSRRSRTPNQSGEGTSEYVSAQEDDNDSESGDESFPNLFPVNSLTRWMCNRYMYTVFTCKLSPPFE